MIYWDKTSRKQLKRAVQMRLHYRSMLWNRIAVFPLRSVTSRQEKQTTTSALYSLTAEDVAAYGMLKVGQPSGTGS